MSTDVRDWGLFKLHLGDCVASMRAMADESADSIVTDPPYGIRFMGEAWDGADIEKRTADRRAFNNNNPPDAGPNGGHNSAAAEAGKYLRTPAGMLAFQIFTQEWAVEAYRVLKPGGHLLSFSSPRTYHRMTCGLEDAGFEIRDQIGWVFGSGFPKAQVWSQVKAERGDADAARMIAAGFEGWARGGLKPAWEPICFARKPMTLNTSDNVLAFGTGALNIDACRVPTDDNLNGGAYSAERQASDSPWAAHGSIHESTGREFAQPLGRFPANLIHDGSDEVLSAFPDAPGQMADASTSSSSRKTQNVYGAMTRGNGRDNEPSADSENGGVVGFKMRPGQRRNDGGTSAARFFKSCSFTKDEGCFASTVTRSFDPRKLPDVSALVSAVDSALPEGLCVDGSRSELPTMSGTPSQFAMLREIVTRTIQIFGKRLWREPPPVELSLSLSLANIVVRRTLTDTTMITISRWSSDGNAAPATFAITRKNLAVGGRVYAPSMDARFIYCAKASKADRGEGNAHPTVKPTELMRYLCRLVTPPGGLVLDPFTGSGSTGKAAMLEGFRFVGCEKEVEHLLVAERRIATAAFGSAAFGAAA